MGAFEARGECCGMQFLFEPLAHPAQRGAAQRIEHAADHDGERDDDGQHQQRVAAAARQHAIVDLEQINGGREKQEIVAAAIDENECERPHAGPRTPTATACAATTSSAAGAVASALRFCQRSEA